MTAVATQTCFIQFILRFSQPLADDEIQHHTSHTVLFAHARVCVGVIHRLRRSIRVIRHD